MNGNAYVAGTANCHSIHGSQGFDHFPILNASANSGSHARTWGIFRVGTGRVKILNEFNTLQVVSPDSVKYISISSEYLVLATHTTNCLTLGSCALLAGIHHKQRQLEFFTFRRQHVPYS